MDAQRGELGCERGATAAATTVKERSAEVVRVGTAAGKAGDGEKHVTLCEALDRLLHKGAVLKGEITISVANVDLVYLGFHVLLASVDTARGLMDQGQRMKGTAEAHS